MAFLLLFSVQLFSQSNGEKLLRFKVISDSSSVEGINVINLVTEKTTVTASDGTFSIYAKQDDLLVLTAVNFEYKRKIIEEEDLKSDLIMIRMVSKVTQLDEVIVNQYPHMNPRDLGIVPKNQKIYTPAERRLYSAQTGPVDIIANLISGRTKQLKKELEVSKKEQLLEKMEFLYEDKYYTETLKIAPEYIDGFQYYLIEDAEFVTALKDRNKTMTMFLASKLAVKYNQIIAEK